MLSGNLEIILLKGLSRGERVSMKACGWDSKSLNMQADELANSDWSPSNSSPFESPRAARAHRPFTAPVTKLWQCLRKCFVELRPAVS
jgi:hypothetical protein